MCECACSQGCELSSASGKALGASLDAAEDAMRCMLQAVYFSSGFAGAQTADFVTTDSQSTSRTSHRPSDGLPPLTPTRHTALSLILIVLCSTTSFGYVEVSDRRSCWGETIDSKIAILVSNAV